MRNANDPELREIIVRISPEINSEFQEGIKAATVRVRERVLDDILAATQEERENPSQDLQDAVGGAFLGVLRNSIMLAANEMSKTSALSAAMIVADVAENLKVIAQTMIIQAALQASHPTPEARADQVDISKLLLVGPGSKLKH